MKLFKTHKTKMLLKGVADLQRMVTELRLQNENLTQELDIANRDLDNAARAMRQVSQELRAIQLELKIKTESYKRIIGG